MFKKELIGIVLYSIVKGIAFTGAALAFIGMVGCTTPVYKTQFIFPDDNLMTDCKITQPPDIATYSKQSWDKKEDILIKDMSTRIVDAGICNERWDKLRKWKQEFSKQQ